MSNKCSITSASHLTNWGQVHLPVRLPPENEHGIRKKQPRYISHVNDVVHVQKGLEFNILARFHDSPGVHHSPPAGFDPSDGTLVCQDVPQTD